MRLPKQVSRRLTRSSGQPRRAGGAWWLVAGFLVHLQVAAQTPPAEPVLKSSRLLADTISPDQRSTMPTFVSGERISSRTDLETVVEGKAVLRRGDIVIQADRLEYFQPEDLAQARGNVRINRAGDVYEGPALDLKLESFEGFFLNPRYRFLKNEGYGEADRVDFIDKDRALIRNASFTTCRRLPGPGWMPDWILRAASISIDNEEEVGQAEGAVLSFMGVPLLPVPAIPEWGPEQAARGRQRGHFRLRAAPETGTRSRRIVLRTAVAGPRQGGRPPWADGSRPVPQL
jgi:LPS-assembly protein